MSVDVHLIHEARGEEFPSEDLLLSIGKSNSRSRARAFEELLKEALERGEELKQELKRMRRDERVRVELESNERLKELRMEREEAEWQLGRRTERPSEIRELKVLLEGSKRRERKLQLKLEELGVFTEVITI